MACCQQSGRRLIGALLATVAFVWILCGVASEAGAKRPYKRHYTSQESRKRRTQYNRYARNLSSAHRRWKVNKDRISKLKKSSFWNRRPYQFATPLIVDDSLYVGVDAGVFYAYQVPRGKKLWKFETEGPVQGKAAYQAGAVFVGDAKGVFYALGAEDGSLRWKAKLDTEILATPLVVAGRVYVSTMSGRLYAMDAGSGAEYWHTDPDDREFGFAVRRSAAPAYDNGLIYQGTSTGELRAIRESDGQVAWVRRLGDIREMVYDVDCTPLLYEGRLYTATADGALYALDPATGTTEWVSEAGGVNDVHAHQGRLLSTGEGSLYSVDPGTGMVFWQQDLERPALSSPAVGDGFIAVVSTIDKIYIIESDTGDIAFERYVRKGSLGDPVVAGDRVFVLSNSGRLFSFKVTKRKPKEKNSRERKKVEAEAEVEQEEE